MLVFASLFFFCPSWHGAQGPFDVRQRLGDPPHGLSLYSKQPLGHGFPRAYLANISHTCIEARIFASSATISRSEDGTAHLMGETVRARQRRVL